MKTVVCVKQAIDVPGFVELDSAGTDVDAPFMEPDLNEADTYAVEEALRLRDEAGEGEVVVLTAGSEGADAALRKCLAMGADHAVRVSCDAAVLHDPIRVARSLAAAIRTQAPELVLCGVQSSDAAQQSTGPALASALGLACISVAKKIELGSADGSLTVQREFEGGLLESVALALPAVLTVQTGANIPRYGTFKSTMRAKKAQIEVVEPGDIGPAASHVRRMFVPTSDGGRSIEMIPGGAADVAARIIQIVQEVS